MTWYQQLRFQSHQIGYGFINLLLLSVSKVVSAHYCVQRCSFAEREGVLGCIDDASVGTSCEYN